MAPNHDPRSFGFAIALQPRAYEVLAQPRKVGEYWLAAKHELFQNFVCIVLLQIGEAKGKVCRLLTSSLWYSNVQTFCDTRIFYLLRQCCGYSTTKLALENGNFRTYFVLCEQRWFVQGTQTTHERYCGHQNDIAMDKQHLPPLTQMVANLPINPCSSFICCTWMFFLLGIFRWFEPWTIYYVSCIMYGGENHL